MQKAGRGITWAYINYIAASLHPSLNGSKILSFGKSIVSMVGAAHHKLIRLQNMTVKVADLAYDHGVALWIALIY